MTDEELEAIEKWCADMLAAYEQGGQMFANEVCAYIDALPTHSVRSTMLTLVADARATRTALRQLADAVRELIDAQDEALGVDDPPDPTRWRDAIAVARRVLVSDVSTQETRDG